MRTEGYILILFVSLSAITLVSAYAVASLSQGCITVLPVDREVAELGGDPVYHLAGDDFARHPALREMILDGKRVIRPTDTVLDGLPRFTNTTEYSTLSITPAEEEALISGYAWYLDEHLGVHNIILEYGGDYYRLAVSKR
ncbi:hypothetical protein FGU65_11630 [Methanoculleus sp. FWC-SCC1]|uniref:Uncharacterized protein n=1 Tax=Methanoculleus frigidifontis TaxID=2584085 RepID=A0ABT8MCC1_9EURY|nr:hypothetical protein [Methanoculleus sp. FWC-SCC1]MDN7025531.1 hypothetical protein [Methanoculleus sp. FWC-SCC1]